MPWLHQKCIVLLWTGLLMHSRGRLLLLEEKKKKRGYTVCSSGYAATDTS
jgi:hypothetical protein